MEKKAREERLRKGMEAPSEEDEEEEAEKEERPTGSFPYPKVD